MSNTLKLNDLFWTFQGEGFNAGQRALFVRLPYCNLSCSWCDTSFNSYSTVAVHDFRSVAMDEPARFAVVTGGEPTMNSQLPALLEELASMGFCVAIESNGCFAPPDGDFWLTVSPKREQKKELPYFVHPVAFARASEFKYVVDADFDFSVLARHEVPTNAAKLYLSPEYNEMQKNLARIETYIKEHPQWKISLQTHKWMGIK